jgi:thiol-disulfide isomerase/thioredoxin
VRIVECLGRLAPVMILVLAGCSATTGNTQSPATGAQPTLAATPSPPPTEPPAEPSEAPSVAQPSQAPAALPSASAAAGWILYDPGLDAPAAVDAALAAAGEDGRHVLIEYGADWCPDCHVLAGYLENPRAKAILDASYHVVRVDVGYFDRNLETANRYGNAIAVGIPSVVILDGDGTKLVDTAAGQLADSRRYDVGDIVDFLTAWQP